VVAYGSTKILLGSKRNHYQDQKTIKNIFLDRKEGRSEENKRKRKKGRKETSKM
jgi:hypothetical protein